MKLVNKDELDIQVAGPVAEDETPEQAIARLEKIFGHKIERYAYEMYETPIVEENQQFPVIIGTVWGQIF